MIHMCESSKFNGGPEGNLEGDLAYGDFTQNMIFHVETRLKRTSSLK